MTIQHEPGTGFEVETEIVWSRVIGVLLAFGLLIAGIYWLFGGDDQDSTAPAETAVEEVPSPGSDSSALIPKEETRLEGDNAVPAQTAAEPVATLPPAAASVPATSAPPTQAPAPTSAPPAPTTVPTVVPSPALQTSAPAIKTKPASKSTSEHGHSHASVPATSHENMGKAGSYTVRTNETLKTIAQQLYGDQQKWLYLAQANPAIKPNALPVGAQLVVPDVSDLMQKRQQQWAKISNTLQKPGSSPQKVTVHPGENLYVLAERAYGNPELWTKIAAANRNKVPDPHRVEVGTVVVIPPLKH